MGARCVVASVASVASAAVLVVVVAAAPASASQDSGVGSGAARKVAAHCSVERVQTQYVKCDDLTGNGVAAPGWVHPRG